MQQQLQQAFRFYQQGNREQAEHICRNILAQYPRQPDALNLMGLLERDRGSFEQAHRLFAKALKKAPGHLHLLNSIGLVEKDMGDFANAEKHYRKALKLDSNYVFALYNLGDLYQTQRKFAQAKRLYREVIRKQPNFVDALANLSMILEKEHETDEAKELVNRALEISPDHFISRLTLTNIAIREKSFGEVLELLLPLLQSRALSPVNQVVAGGKCAYAYEQLGDYKSAFNHYRDTNQVLHQQYLGQMQTLESFYAPEAVARIADTIAGFDFSPRDPVVPSPVFLIGFPRSGTTLLDQILSSHSQITVLEEKDNLIDAYTRFPSTVEGLQELENASDSELKKLRQGYWKNIDRELGTGRKTPIIVDKYPLNAIVLLHISRLFPNARIITALRDPRDCVFSCYQQRFDINQAMYQLLNLDSAVAYYDLVMEIIVRMRKAQALPMHIIRYENVIENFTEEIKSMTDFLELEWEDALLDYQSTARSRSITTPSALQVIQPLYKSSIGKWKNYRQWIGSSFEPLDKWAEEWGYEH